MHHDFGEGHIYFGYGILFFAGLIFIVVAVFVIFKLINNYNDKNIDNDDLTDKQKNALENFSGLVSSMLYQQGNGLKQYEISKNLNLPLDMVSKKLAEMEKEGAIVRNWDNEEYTFTVKKNN